VKTEMRRRARRLHRGLSLLEVMVSLAILGISSLGLIGGVIISMQSNALAARRTQMKEFAQARVERLLVMTPVQLNQMLNNPKVSTAMNSVGTFDPNALPGTGGWMMDIIDGYPGNTGFDTLSGPVVADVSAMSGTDPVMAKTAAMRSSMLDTWSTTPNSATCANPAVANDPAALCRELHIEATLLANGMTTYTYWVRVLRGAADPATALILEGTVQP
jgi:prepilin-type N-terminal cleavage/methylation domain-containing protein